MSAVTFNICYVGNMINFLILSYVLHFRTTQKPWNPPYILKIPYVRPLFLHWPINRSVGAGLATFVILTIFTMVLNINRFFFINIINAGVQTSLRVSTNLTCPEVNDYVNLLILKKLKLMIIKKQIQNIISWAVLQDSSCKNPCSSLDA